MEISKNYVRGPMIISADYLWKQKLVYHKNWGLRPMGFIQNMQFRLIMSSLHRGLFFKVRKKENNDKTNN